MFIVLAIIATIVLYAKPLESRKFNLEQLKGKAHKSETFRSKRDANNVGFGFNNGFSIPGLGNVLQEKAKIAGANDQFGSGASGNVDTKNPNLSLQRGFTGFGLVNNQEGIDRVGARGNGNFGAGFGRNLGILGNQFGVGDNSDVNYNKEKGVDIQNQRGLTGIFTQKTGVNVNPQAGGGFGLQRKTCIGEAFIPGLCFNQGGGINLG